MFAILEIKLKTNKQRSTHPCSTLVLGLWPETDSELSASEGTTAKNLS